MSDYYLEQLKKEREANAKVAIERAIAVSEAEKEFTNCLTELEQIGRQAADPTIQMLAECAFRAISYLAKQ